MSRSNRRRASFRGRVARRRRLVLLSAGGWLLAGLVAIAAAVLVADGLVAGMLAAPGRWTRWPGGRRS
jgi:hypothetical protein